MSRVSLMFAAYNRLEFTRESWAALMANTDWSRVAEFHVYDDGSTDGTQEFLRAQVAWLLTSIDKPTALLGRPVYLHLTGYHSPMGVTLDWIKRSEAPILAKLDNDTIYPPGWLTQALQVMDNRPDLDCLGLECMRTPVMEGPRTYLPATFVSGLGLYRKRVFEKHLPADNGYFGFEEFMQAYCKCGWILPSLPVFLLDRLPFEPWSSLSEQYVAKGWQRPWSLALRYKMEQRDMWEWWLKGRVASHPQGVEQPQASPERREIGAGHACPHCGKDCDCQVGDVDIDACIHYDRSRLLGDGSCTPETHASQTEQDTGDRLNCGHVVIDVEAGACGVKGCVNEHQQE